jgi:hypothetical protein
MTGHPLGSICGIMPSPSPSPVGSRPGLSQRVSVLHGRGRTMLLQRQRLLDAARWSRTSDMRPFTPCFNARMTGNQPWWLTMPPAEVAATILPLFSYSSCPPVSEWGAVTAIASWCRTGSYSEPVGSPVGADAWMALFRNPDSGAIAEAIQVLEHANLLMHWGDYVGLTRLGWHALQTNTVRQHLGLDAAPPTA